MIRSLPAFYFILFNCSIIFTGSVSQSIPTIHTIISAHTHIYSQMLFISV
jgi:hypothetical protein